MVVATCHCGAVELDVAEAPQQLTSCNCSICRRLGTLWAYYHPSQVKIVAAPGATATYVWGDRCLALHHCKACGCVTHWEPLAPTRQDRMGVNARLMEPAVIEHVRVRRLDGAATWEFLD